MKLTSESEEQTQVLGEIWPTGCNQETSCCWMAELGAGKTVLTKGIAKGLGTLR